MFDARLRTLLGAAPGDALYAQYLSLIDNPSAVESTDLDYKGEQYGKGTEGYGELAKDVAALANASGGTLILGLREDRSTSIPKHPNPEPLTDRLRKNYREALVLRLEPPVDCDIHFIAEDPAASSPQGLVVISVPPSARGPHAVIGTTDLRDGTLRFPYRNDNHTAHMNLNQIKRAISAAASLANSREEALQAAYRDVEVDSRRSPTPRITVVLAPDLPGVFPIDGASYLELSRELTEVQFPFYGRDIFGSFGVGPRRFIASTGTSRSRHVAHFHSDGTAAWATEGSVIQAFNDEMLPEPTDGWHTEHVAMAVLAMLQSLARHAVNRAGAAGTASARLTLDVGNRGSCGLASPRGAGPHFIISTEAQQFATGRASLLLSAAEGGSSLVQAAAVLLADCYQHFGVVEAEQFTLDGKINLSAWGARNHAVITAWAEAENVEVTT